jgi:hypothetical protein
MFQTLFEHFREHSANRTTLNAGMVILYPVRICLTIVGAYTCREYDEFMYIVSMDAHQDEENVIIRRRYTV